MLLAIITHLSRKYLFFGKLVNTFINIDRDFQEKILLILVCASEL